MLTQLPSNKATFTQLVSLFLLKTSFCMRRNAQNVFEFIWEFKPLFKCQKCKQKAKGPPFNTTIVKPWLQNPKAQERYQEHYQGQF